MVQTLRFEIKPFFPNLIFFIVEFSIENCKTTQNNNDPFLWGQAETGFVSQIF